MKTIIAAMGLSLALLATNAAAQSYRWSEGAGWRGPQSAERDHPGWKKGRDATPPPRREGDSGSRLTPDQREQLRRDLERANREIYHRKRRD